jgi:hypothetical protein
VQPCRCTCACAPPRVWATYVHHDACYGPTGVRSGGWLSHTHTHTLSHSLSLSQEQSHKGVRIPLATVETTVLDVDGYCARAHGEKEGKLTALVSMAAPHLGPTFCCSKNPSQSVFRMVRLTCPSLEPIRFHWRNFTHTQSVVLLVGRAALCLMHKSQAIILASSYRCIQRTVSHQHKVVF